MRVLLSCDMEGATGVVSFDQVSRGTSEYEFGRDMQLKDTLAVIAGAREAGAHRILINDAHESMRNLDVRALPRDVELLSGWPKNLCMMEGAPEADVALLVAYHAMAGTERAVLDHTMSAAAVHEVRLNGRAVGEIGLGAALCGALGLPVALVTGDVAACLEAESLLPGVVTCPVKEGHGRFSARVLTPEVTAERLAQADAFWAAEEKLQREVYGIGPVRHILNRRFLEMPWYKSWASQPPPSQPRPEQ